MKLKLIEDWRDAWRMSSNWASAALGLLVLVQSDLLPAMQPFMAPETFSRVVAGFAVLIVACRITIAQDGTLKLIENWRDAVLMSSNWAAGALGALAVLQSDLVPYVQPLLSPAAFAKVAGALAVLRFVCRLIDQPSLRATPVLAAELPRQGGV